MSETKETPFRCGSCGMTFSSQNDLNMHNKQAHPAGGEEQLRDGGKG